jgi:hypothetical protein
VKDHPLFNDDPNDIERRERNIGFINIVEFDGSKKTTLPNQWEPEELQTAEDVYNAVGGPGRFELVGRDTNTKRVVDRCMIILKAKNGANAAAPAAPAAPREEPRSSTAQPMMTAGGMTIPSGMDPSLAMVLSLVAAQNQQSAAMLAAQREDNKTYMSQQVQLMLGMTNANTQLVTGLVTGLSQAFGNRPAPGGSDSAAEAFIKGVETMVSLHAGIKEGEEEKNGPTPKNDWTQISANIVESIKGIRDVAQATNAVTSVAAGGNGAGQMPPAGP